MADAIIIFKSEAFQVAHLEVKPNNSSTYGSLGFKGLYPPPAPALCTNFANCTVTFPVDHEVSDANFATRLISKASGSLNTRRLPIPDQDSVSGLAIWHKGSDKRNLARTNPLRLS